MSKIAISAVLALVVGSAVTVGIYATQKSDKSEETRRSYEQLAQELSDLREDLQTARGTTRALAQRLQLLESGQEAMATRLTASEPADAVPAAAATEGTPATALASISNPSQLKEYVFAAIEEERQLRDEERQQQREEMRQRFEERRKLVEELSKGPYDRYNLKVNSLASVLEMSDAQKQAYYELAKQHRAKAQEAREKLSAAAAAAGGEGGEQQRRGRGRGDREQYRELYEGQQKEFATAVQEIFSPYQLETYNKLSRSAQSFQDSGYVSAPGEELSGMERFMGGGMQGFRGRRGGGRGR